MAFSTLPSALIAVGRAIRKEIFQTLKDNQDDLQSRLLTVEGAANKVVIFDFPVLNASSAVSLTGLTDWEAPFSFNLLSAEVGIYEKGGITAGTLEIDIRKNTSRSDTGMTSVFTTRPSLDLSTASDYDNSTNAVLVAGQIPVSTGDVLRLDVTSLPTTGGTLGKFFIKFIGEAS